MVQNLFCSFISPSWEMTKDDHTSSAYDWKGRIFLVPSMVSKKCFSFLIFPPIGVWKCNGMNMFHIQTYFSISYLTVKNSYKKVRWRGMIEETRCHIALLLEIPIMEPNFPAYLLIIHFFLIDIDDNGIFARFGVFNRIISRMMFQ